MRRAALLTLAALLGPAARAETFAAAATSFTGLLQPAAARGIGLGGADAAVAEGGEALDSNPAGLADSLRGQASFSHFLLLQGASLEEARLSLPLDFGFGPGGAVGGQLRYLYAGEFERRDDNGALLAGSIRPWGLYGQAALAQDLGNSLQAGASLAILGQTIDAAGQAALALGGGMLWRPAQFLSLAAGINQLGGGAGERLLPTNFYGAAAWRSEGAGLSWLFCGQANWVPAGLSSLGAGLEAAWQGSYFARLGCRLAFEPATLPGLAGPALGLGARLADWDLEYGASFQGDLGLLQVVSLAWSFGASPPPPPPPG